MVNIWCIYIYIYIYGSTYTGYNGMCIYIYIYMVICIYQYINYSIWLYNVIKSYIYKWLRYNDISLYMGQHQDLGRLQTRQVG